MRTCSLPLRLPFLGPCLRSLGGVVGLLAAVLVGSAPVVRGADAAAPATATAILSPGWPLPPNTPRPWTRWWWPGSAVDEENLTAQLEAFARVGLGGVEITPIYGARGAEERYVDFLSPRWMELLAHVGREARRLGLGVDMATGTGWPFGGPSVPPEDAAQKLVLEEDGTLGLEPTGQTVKRAAPGGEGWVLDPYSTRALEHYLAQFDAAFAGFPDGLVRGQFHDSFEYYGASGTAALTDRFEAMHGYRLDDWAPILMGTATADADTVGRLKADYRLTLDQLHQAYLGRWAEWAHGHGWQTRNQSHGAPANLLDLYALADIPETEIFGSSPFPIPGLRRDATAIRQGDDLPEPLVSRLASSAAHVMGKPLVSCETATWLRDHWKVALAFVKPEIDRVFLDGINHIFYHGTVYSPADAPWPGWLFYASTQFNPNNPWWDDFAALNAYVTRVQTLLQGGQPDNDVLVYWPAHDVWHDAEGLMKQLTVHDVEFVNAAPYGATVRALRAAGYAFDTISDAQLEASVGVPDGILTPGQRYATIVVPPTRHLPVRTLEALLGLAANGATVIFEALPEDVPGLGRLESRRSELAAGLASLGFPETATDTVEAVAYGTGRVLRGDPVTALGEVAGAHSEPLVATGLDFLRRRRAEGRDYFLANLGATAVDGWVPLGTPALGVTMLDPLTGAGGVAALRRRPDGGPEVLLQLPPGASILLRTQEAQLARGPAWPYFKPSAPARPLAGRWAVTFVEGGPTLPDGFTTTTLASWTASGDPEAERFAGTARYELTFEHPGGEADDWRLELGDVRESARVTLNGHFLGTLWSLPFQLRVGSALQPGRNTLLIEVTNTAANRIRDLDQRGVEWKIMREINFVNIRYRPFDASGWAIEPAGLLGPVRLQPLERILPD